MSEDIDTVGDGGVRSAWISVGAPILGLIFIVIMLAIAALASFAREQDRMYAESTTRLAAGALSGRNQSLSGILLDYANWDQTYQAVTNWDQDWVENNIYSSVVDGMIIFQADGSIRYAWFNDASLDLAADARPAAVAAALRVPGLRGLSRAEAVQETIAGTVARVGDQLILVSVAPITPEDDDARRARPRNVADHYLAMVDILSADEFASMGEALDLTGFKFEVRSSAGEDMIGDNLVAASGRYVGRLEWRHAHPGPAAFNRQIWPVVVGLLCIGALAILIAHVLVSRQVKVISNARAALDANNAKSEFLTRVSHELRTPLNAIIGYAEIIQEETPALETRADAGRIISAARHLGHLLNDIIDQSRIDSGRIKINSEVLPVAGMLAEVQGLMGPQAKSAGINLNISSSPLADFAYADHVRLRQCLLNMIGNAIKFSPRGGVVTVRARKEKQGDSAIIVFDIADAGLGIAKSDLDNVFRPFGQANASIGKTFGGSGLGLSISRELARQMGGDIVVQSELGKGSTFSLLIPAATASALKVA